MNIKQKMGEKLRTIRKHQGYTQELIAEKLGISPTAYAKIERGETDISLSRLEEIATAFEVSAEKLISECSATFIGNSFLSSTAVNNGTNTNQITDPKVENLHEFLENLLARIENLEKTMHTKNND